jgi:hypothetical protein
MKEGTMALVKKRRTVSLAEGGGIREIPIELATLSQRAKEVQIAAELVQAQADALLAAARNATDAPLFKDADALACEVALDEVRFALQAIARGFGAIRIEPAYEALWAVQAAEKAMSEP